MKAPYRRSEGLRASEDAEVGEGAWIDCGGVGRCANAFALYPTPAGETVGNHIRGINRVMGRRERKGC